MSATTGADALTGSAGNDVIERKKSALHLRLPMPWLSRHDLIGRQTRIPPHAMR